MSRAFQWILVLMAITPFFCHAQEDTKTLNLEAVEAEISDLAVQMHQDTSLSNRTYVAHQIKKILTAALKKEGAYAYAFDKIKGIAVLQPENKRFRMFTWEMYEHKERYVQFGVIHTKEGKVFELTDQSHEMRQPEFGRNKANNWYGALYYNLKTFTSNNREHYLLFGRDSYQFFERRKVIDILYFDHKGAPRFGSNIIKVKDGFGRMRTVNRYILQYVVTADIKCNYNKELDMVIFDHLISGNVVEGDGPRNVPDGSYCGLRLVNGIWEYVDKVFEDDPHNVLVNDQNPNVILRRKTKKRNASLEQMFGNKNKRK